MYVTNQGGGGGADNIVITQVRDDYLHGLLSSMSYRDHLPQGST